MHAFIRNPQGVTCRFEDAEIQIMYSMLGQLIELLSDVSVPPGGVGTQLVFDRDPTADHDSESSQNPLSSQNSATADDSAGDVSDGLFDWLENEFGETGFSVVDRTDPVIARLFPDAYPDDPNADHEFRRFTQTELVNDKIRSAQVVMQDLELIKDDGLCTIEAGRCQSWLKALTNLRLTLASRLGIECVEDSEKLVELAENDPKSWVFAIYEWLGFVQESLLASCD